MLVANSITHFVEPGLALVRDLVLQLCLKLDLTLVAEFPSHQLTGSVANAVGDIVASDIEIRPSPSTPRTMMWVWGGPVL
jgi:hypothetical protein